MHIDKTTFRDRFKQFRSSQNLTQRQAAQLISPNLSIRTVQDWERKNGNKPPQWVQDMILKMLD